MGKIVVRNYAPILDAQSVWKEFETHMSISSKGLNKSVNWMYMCPLLSMTDHGKALLNNLFFISMNKLGH